MPLSDGKTIYLDWAATAVPCYSPLDPMEDGLWANPSSTNVMSEHASATLEDARAFLAGELGVKASQLYFTSGATESNASVLHSFEISATSRTAKKIVTFSFNHPSIEKGFARLRAQDYEIKMLSCDEGIDLDKFGKELDGCSLVVISAVDNETGYMPPLAEITQRVRAYEKQSGRSVSVHADCVQLWGKRELNLGSLEVDFASLSFHKIGGPRGVGLLYARKPFEPLMLGGGQERGMRSGTENLRGVLEGVQAYKNQKQILTTTLEHLSHRLTEYMRRAAANHMFLLPRWRMEMTESFSPAIFAIAMPPYRGELLKRLLADQNIITSTGSACSQKNRDEKLAVKKGALMGLSRVEALGAVRISMGKSTTEQDLEALFNALDKIASEKEF